MTGKLFGRTQNFRTDQKKSHETKLDDKISTKNVWTKKIGRLMIREYQTKKKIKTKFWSPAKILVAGENLGRRRKSWSSAKILVVVKNLDRR